jgi:ATP-dependent Lhr-like helicase
LYQRHVTFGRQRLAVLYVAPTKALVNDLYLRLQDYLGSRSDGLIRRYTGDHHELTGADDVFLALATPEALDSLSLVKPELFSGVRAMVLDEIHLLHGTPRGQQLMNVIRRIRAHSQQPRHPRDEFHLVGMTATIGDVEDVSRRWLGADSVIVQAGEPRPIEMTYIRDSNENGPAEAFARWIQASQVDKVLVFSNTRNSAHRLAAELDGMLSGSKWPVYLHIGVLSASERERVEDGMRRGRRGICVATSTLEIGIDIGDIDAVLLAQPPSSVSSFLQRIGRGNRRTDTCNVVVYTTSERTELVFQALHRCAQLGTLDEAHEYDRPSVGFQQVLSLAWYGVRHEQPLTRANVADRTGGLAYEDVINDMLETQALVDVRGALIPSDELMDEGDARRIHSVIAESSGTGVVDVMSGEIVAKASRGTMGEGLVFIGGRLKNVNNAADGIVYLERPPKRGKLDLARLPASRGKKGLSRRLSWAVGELAGADPSRWSQVGGRVTTWGGSSFNRLLATVLKHRGVRGKAEVDDYGISGLELTSQVSPEEVAATATDLAERERLSADDARHFNQSSRYFNRLSPRLQRVEALRAVPWAGFLRWLGECKTGQ